VQARQDQLNSIKSPVSHRRSSANAGERSEARKTMADPELRPAPPRLTLVLGGARSGKSRHAERLVVESGLDPVYVATAEALDDEMAARIAQHRKRRGPCWRTVEEPLDLPGVLLRESGPERAVLVDCLTLWLTNLMVAKRTVRREVARVVELLPHLPGRLVLVSNEVGLGVMPTDAMARAFIDHAGWLHQSIAERADVVVFMAAGLPLHLKSPAEG
jgi:adenosylcobinamide kinase/adenosylcobinamide-phosphate guanylyltransferase